MMAGLVSEGNRQPRRRNNWMPYEPTVQEHVARFTEAPSLRVYEGRVQIMP